jgi:succinate dehydrogenase/fumarate reductase-like Fe-S protein
MTVNGKARWTCRTHVASVADDDRLEIGPLHNLPVVKDLVTDMAPFFDKWAAAKGQFRGTATRKDEGPSRTNSSRPTLSTPADSATSSAPWRADGRSG